jgi:hypothetical protein
VSISRSNEATVKGSNESNRSKQTRRSGCQGLSRAPAVELETDSNSSTSSHFSKDKATRRVASPSDDSPTQPIDLTGNPNHSRKKQTKTPTSDDHSSEASVHSLTYSAPNQDGTPRTANSAPQQRSPSNRADYSPPRSLFHNMDVDHWTGTAPDGASAKSNDD